MRIIFSFFILIFFDVVILSFAQAPKSIELIKKMDSTTTLKSEIGPPPEDEEDLPNPNSDIDLEKQNEEPISDSDSNDSNFKN